MRWQSAGSETWKIPHTCVRNVRFFDRVSMTASGRKGALRMAQRPGVTLDGCKSLYCVRIVLDQADEQCRLSVRAGAASSPNFLAFAC